MTSTSIAAPCAQLDGSARLWPRIAAPMNAAFAVSAQNRDVTMTTCSTVALITGSTGRMDTKERPGRAAAGALTRGASSWSIIVAYCTTSTLTEAEPPDRSANSPLAKRQPQGPANASPM